MELVQVTEDYPSGIYLIKGEETENDGIRLQTGGVGCFSHIVNGDFYKVADCEEEQKHWIFNDDFWYLMHKFDDETFLSPPMNILNKIDWSKDGHDAFDTYYKWIKKKYNLNKPKYKLGAGFDEWYKHFDDLKKASIKDQKPISDLNKMIEETILDLSSVKIKILDNEIEEAFVNVEILEGELAGPAILTWDNCD